MSVENLATKAVYSTNGVVKEFDIPFQFTNLNQIAVYLTDMILGETVKINSNIEINEYTKKVTYPLVDLPLESGWQITIIRETVPSQESNLTQSGWFQPKVLMDMCDKLTLITQEHAEKIARSIRYSVNENPTELETKGFLSIVEAARDQAIIARDEAIEVYSLLTQLRDDTIAFIDQHKIEMVAMVTDNLNSFISQANNILNELIGIKNEVQGYKDAVYADRLLVEAKAQSVKTHFDSVVNMRSQVGNLVGIAETYKDEVESMQYDIETRYSQISALKNQTVIAATSAENALIAISEAITKVVWHDVVFITHANSPLTISQAHNGKLFSIDCSGGDVEILLPEIDVLDLDTPWTIGVKKTDASDNKIIIESFGTDLIDGSTVKLISNQDAGATLIPDIDPSPDQWTSCDFGGIGGGIGAPQGSRTSPLLLMEGSQITPASGKSTQVIFIASSGGAITLNNLEPLKTINMKVGEKVVLIGASDEDTVTFVETEHFILNGDAELKNRRSLEVEFIGSDGVYDSYQEARRNF